MRGPVYLFQDDIVSVNVGLQDLTLVTCYSGGDNKFTSKLNGLGGVLSPQLQILSLFRIVSRSKLRSAS